VKRLELVRVRVCQRCGRGRAELEGADGATLAIPVDPVRAHELERHGEGDDVPWLSALFLELVRGAGGNVREVVLDADVRGLRALVSITRGDDTDVVACTPQEGVGLAARGRLPIYATADALATAQPTSESDGHDRLH
jgi:bifunctional DNase/RNase